MHTPGAKLSATGLKWIAYACMLLDHFAYAFLYYRSPACIALRTAGKMALPIFCFLLAEGYCHTKSVRRYLMRLLMFALISQPFYSSFCGWVYTREWKFTVFSGGGNVLFTLFLALLSLVAWEHIKPLFARCAACAALFVCAALLPLDWGWYALAIVWGCFYMRGRSGRPALLLCGIFAVIVASLWLGALPNLGSQYLQFFGVFFSLLPMRLYDGTPGAGARVKWRFYLIYPAQFILIPLLGRRLAP